MTGQPGRATVRWWPAAARCPRPNGEGVDDMGTTARVGATRAARAGTVLTAVTACTAAVVALAGGTAGAGPADTMTLVDDTGLLTVDVPIGWTDVTTAPVTVSEAGSLPQIVASPNQQLFYDTYDTPGVIYTAAPFQADTATAITATYDFTGICQDTGVTAYDDGYFVGSTQRWTACDGGTASIVTVFANPPDSGFSASVLVQVPTATDEEALTTILNTFYVTESALAGSPTPPGQPSAGAPAAPGAPASPAVTAPPGAGAALPESTDVVDDTGTLYVAVPLDWTATITSPVNDEFGNELPSILAAPDSQQYAAATGPGMYLLAEPYTADLNAVIARLAPPGCPAGPVTPYTDPVFSGFTQEFTNCNGGHVVTTLAVNPIGRTDYTISGDITVAPTDTTTLGLILGTFNFAAPASSRVP